jgi:long-chain acyl-CoA synthetase
LIAKKRPSFIAGVPALYEHVIRSKWLQKADLSCLRGIFCGGDTLPIESKEKIDKFLKEHNCSYPIREGYGCTECVAATTITPDDDYRPGTVGIPMPDVLYKIVIPGTDERQPYGEVGEICISGPELMIYYYNNPEETEKTIRQHADGLRWLHTGDLGYMDSDGFIYFKQRLKRMIVTSGYNVYPSQIENVLNYHPDVQASCVIGVPDKIRGSKVWAYIVPEKGVSKDGQTVKKLKAYCKENIAKYAIPREYRFVDVLPRTKINKIDYRALERLAAEELSNTDSND